MKPEISIIIPTRNEGKYLEKTLKQYIPLKKKLKIEIIVSDGGSKDRTVSIAKKYADEVILPKKNQKQNIAIGRNAGARVARGKLLFHTDADVIIPNKEEFFSRLSEIFKKKEIIAVTTRLRIYPWEERLDDKIFNFIFNTTVKLGNVFGSFMGRGECEIVRASSFRKINGYNEKIVVGEDHNLFYRLGKIGKVIYANDLGVYHSPRRFRKEGYLRITLVYIREGISLVLRGKSFLNEWKPFR